MERRPRYRLLGGVLFGAIASACASIMGVEAPVLQDPDASAVDGGGLSDGNGSTPGLDGSDPDAGCVGPGCACATDPDCKGESARKCVAGKCAECTTEPDSCQVGRYCTAGSTGLNECATGCKADSECELLSPVTPYCITARHQCARCRTNADCPAGSNQECSPSGTCADKCTGDGGSCPLAGQTCCNKLCVDVTSDVFNCNGCGLPCAGSDALCCAGQCKSSLTSADACGSCTKQCKAATGAPLCVAGACAPASCADVLATNPAATTGVYLIDPDGAGTGAPFSVLCDMTTAGGGWMLVGRELAQGTGRFRFLEVDTANPAALAAGTESGLIGKRFLGKYTQVWIGWSTDSYIRFTRPANFDLFANVVNTNVAVSSFTTSDATLAGWVSSAGGAKLCVATKNSNIRPGDTSWAVKPSNDNNSGCGCNSGGWTGRGAFYGGTVAGQETTCDGWGGGWAGVRDNGAQKGGITPAYETRIWIK